MPISIVDVHAFVRSMIKKNKGGFISSSDIDSFVNRGVSDWQKAVISKFKNTGRFEYDHQLVKKASYTVTSSTSKQALPADYAEGLTIYHTNANGVEVEGTIYSWDEFLEIQNSSILAPDREYPAATIFIDTDSTAKIQLAPVPVSGNHLFTLVYMRKPVKAFFNQVVTDGNISAAASGHTDIDIDDRYFSDIVSRALMYMGISLPNQLLAQTEAMMDSNQKTDER